MNKNKRLVGYLSLLSLLFSINAAAEITLSGTNGEKLVYEGNITFESNQLAQDLYDKAKVKPTIVEITSLGGGINAGLALGEWIIANELDISIPQYCVSSCANYIFVAGKTKHLGKNAYLIWHGGAKQPGLTRMLKNNAQRRIEQTIVEEKRSQARAAKYAEIDAHIAFIQTRETNFYARIGVDPNIPVLGQLFPYRSTDANQSSSGWDYSMRDLARLGVSNVLIEGGHWMPNAANQGIHVRRLVLQP